MRCDDADLLIDALAEGALDATERAPLEAHVASCARCAAALAASRSLSRALAALPEPSLPAAADARVRAALDEEARYARLRRRLRRGAIAVAAGGAVLAASVTALVAIPASAGLADGAASVVRVTNAWVRLHALPALDASQQALAVVAATLAALLLLERATSPRRRLVASRR